MNSMRSASGSLWTAEEVSLIAEVADRLLPESRTIAEAWTDALLRHINSALTDSAQARERITEMNQWFLLRHLTALREKDLERAFADNLEGNVALLQSQQAIEPELQSTLSQLYLSLEISMTVIFARVRVLYAEDPRLSDVLSLYSRLSVELAKIVGVAFYEVRSATLQSALRTVSSLLEASRELNRHPSGVDGLLTNLTRIVQRLVRCDMSLAFLWRESEQAYVAEAGLGFSDRDFYEIRRHRFRRGEFAVMDEILGGQVVTGTRDDGRVPREMMERFGQMTYAVAPIAFSKDSPLGTLAAYRTERTPFDRTDLEILRGVAQNAALAIANAMLVQKLESDLAERLRVEAELARARDAALESVRLKSAFLANVSHEIRTPLNIIGGYNQMIADRFAELGDDSQQESIEAVERASRRLVRTVQCILDTSKMETSTFENNPKPLRLGPIVAELTRDFQRYASAKGLTVSCEIGEPDAAVVFDEYCLSQALLNLLDNAVKFTDRGGVVVRLQRDPNGALRLEIRDTGVGIDEKYRSRLFERFSQEESGYTRRFEGSGLGLSLVKNYLELNGARVTVESEKHKGSVFTIHFAQSVRSASQSESRGVA